MIKAASTPAEFDEQLATLDSEIEREEVWLKGARTRYHASFVAKKERTLNVLKCVRETVRVARQNHQMTGMSGKRIE